MKFNSLKKRVLSWFGAVTFIILVLFALVFNYILNASLDKNIQTKLQDVANTQVHSGDIHIAIFKKGNLIQKDRGFDLQNPQKYLQQNQSFFIIEHAWEDDFIDALYIKKKSDQTILVYQKNIDNKIENFQDILLFFIPLLLLTLIFLASKMIDKILTPIHNLTKATQTISVSDFSQNIPIPKEEDDIKALVVSFNDMIGRLREGVHTLDRFNSDVSHELKTPLTVIQGEVEVTLRKLREPKAYQESMQTIYQQSKQIQNIVEQLLFLTKYSKENIQQSFEQCALDKILLSSVDNFETALKEKDITLTIQKIEPIMIEANPSLINSIFANLLDNAIKYTPNGKNITISLFLDKQIHFIIQDEGIGIPQEQLSKITDRFYRVDEARNKKIEGFGLGLSIVKKSVELHGGVLRIDSEFGEGVKVEVLFK